MQISQLIKDNLGIINKPINMARNDDGAEIYIYDVISSDWGVGAMDVITAIAQAGDVKTLHVHINSPGGDIFEGRAIMAALKSFKGKTIAHIDSLCASAATSIALACDEVEMSDGAFFMIHNASGLVWGDKSDMREMADLLEKLEGAIVNDYTSKTGKTSEEVVAWMNAETWFTASEALEHGFIDSITQTKSKAENAWNLSAYNHAPAELTTEPAVEAVTDPDPVPELSITTNTNRLRLAMI